MKQQPPAGTHTPGKRLSLITLAALILPLFAISLLLSGCSDFFRAVNNNPSGGTSTFLYTTNVDGSGSGGTITEYSLTSGALATLSGSPISLSATPTSIAVAPNNKFLFVGTSLGVFLYTIGTDGTLTQGNNNTIVYLGPTSTQALTVDSTSSWLIIANKNSTELDALPIDPTTGVPTSNTPATAVLSDNTPQQLVIAPANDYIFVALGANGTDAFTFSTTGSKPFATRTHKTLLSAVSGGHAASTSANTVGVDTKSTYLFIGESGSNQLRQIAIADITQDGDAADYAVGKDPSAILADFTNTYVYVANKTDNTISGFTLNAGSLTALDGSPFATAKAPLALAEDSSKTYIFAAGFGANPNLWEYYFDTTVPGNLDVKNTTSTASTSPSYSNAIAATH